MRRLVLAALFLVPSAAAFPVEGRVTPFVTPEEGTPIVLDFLGAARSRLDIAVYTWESATFAHAAAKTAERGVRVRVLLEGGPVGGIDEAEQAIIARLAEAGVDVRFASRAVPYMHAKYALRDANAVLVGSENWNPSAFPTTPRPEGGSRGWGIVIENATLASRLAALFESDFASGTRAEPEPALTHLLAEPVATRRETPISEASFFAELIAAPGAEGPIVAALDSARETIDLQGLFFESEWDEGPSPFAQALERASARGVHVRVQLDGRFPRAGHDALVRTAERSGYEVRLASAERTLHNKGVVLDGKRVILGSVNWGETSATRNREVALLLESPEIAGFFALAFERDWTGGASAGARASPDAGFAGVLALAFALAGRTLTVGATRRKSRGRGRKSRSG